MRKSLEEAGRRCFREGFKLGAERGYKEAIARAKDWFWIQWRNGNPMYINDDFLADFEADMMNKLWEEQK